MIGRLNLLVGAFTFSRISPPIQYIRRSGASSMSFNQTFKNLGRIREIIGVLIKYGLEDIIVNSSLRNFVTESRRLTWLRKEKPVFELTRWERIRMVCEELGPTFVKLAQVMSNRPDMLPAPLITELEKLQDNVGPFGFSKVKDIIEADLGRPLDHIFEEFDEIALASASIGQVHKAVLKNGQAVVVKVRRPDVVDLVHRDLTILLDAVQRSDRYLRKQGVINAIDFVKSFERSMNKELDYRTEARNLEKFRSLYKGYKNFYIPKPFREYSSDRVLVMEQVFGCKISDVPQMRNWGLDPRKVAENGMNIYLMQIFEFGIFHADPHPGNVLVRKDGVICLIDFGMVGTLMEKDKYAFAGIFVAMSDNDARKMALAMKSLAIEDNIEDMRAFEYDLNEIIEDFVMLDVSESSIAEMVERLQKVMYDYQIRVPGGIFLIFRAFAILEGIGKTIHPTFNTYEFIRPYGLKLVQQRLKPQNIWKEVSDRFGSVNAMLTSIPRDIKEIVSKAKKGNLLLKVDLQGYGYLLKKWDSITNRLSLTLLTVAFIIGSSISMTADWSTDMPLIAGIPAISVYGLWIAAFFLVLLLYSIVRRRKYK